MRILYVAIACLLSTAASAQLNMTRIAQLDYSVGVNDVWGYLDADDDVEYALVGLGNGLSIVSLADPAAPEEIFFIPGESTTWRDIKTYAGFAYVTSDNTNEGLLIVDLNDLPASAPYRYPEPGDPDYNILRTACHNIGLDEAEGFIYLSGCGGVNRILDPKVDPWYPAVINPSYGTDYAHDLYTVNGRSYLCHIYTGFLSIYDVTDKADVPLLGGIITLKDFTHSVWADGANVHAYAVDEKADAPVTSYNVSDPTDIQLLDTYFPLGRDGRGVVPHNVIGHEDWLLVSHYSEGVRVLDISRPDNLVEVGYFDTYLGPEVQYSGNWGVYPDLPSELVLVSDRSNGLFVFEPNYVRAAFLEGTITDAQTGAPIGGATVRFTDNQLAELTRTDGAYGTGRAEAGTFEVEIFALGYAGITTSVSLTNGVVTVFDAALEPVQKHALAVRVIDAATGNPVSGAYVRISDAYEQRVYEANGSGLAAVGNVNAGNFELLAGRWGYRYTTTDIAINSGQTVDILVERGYEDDFVNGFDYDWNAFNGNWVLDQPLGTTHLGLPAAPSADVADDNGDLAYVTRNSQEPALDNDVDAGPSTWLASPPMDLTDYAQPVIQFNAWVVNRKVSDTQTAPPDDDLQVWLVNDLDAGSDAVLLTTLSGPESGWKGYVVEVPADFALSTTAYLRLQAEDRGEDHLLEVGFDKLRVVDGLANEIAEAPAADFGLTVAPNPVADVLHLRWKPSTSESITWQIIDVYGRTVQTFDTPGDLGRQALAAPRQAGVYTIIASQNGRTVAQHGFVKQ